MKRLFFYVLAIAPLLSLPAQARFAAWSDQPSSSKVEKYEEGSLFSRRDRLSALEKAGIDDGMLQAILYEPEEEKEMVDTALRYFADHRAGLDQYTQACLWEEMAWIINYRQQQPVYRVSWGYRWNHEGKTYFVYQGPLAFQGGRHATLVIAPDGTAYQGLAEPITDIHRWTVDLNALTRM